MLIMNFIKSVGIYQLFILQFAITIVKGNSEGVSSDGILNKFQKEVTEKAEAFWGSIKDCLGKICSSIGSNYGDTCKQLYVAIPVVVFFFLFVFGIICLICCKCCCKNSCCKKDENDESDKSDESDVDYNQFIMGPDGQMYSQMYEGQMMDPQLFQAGMMYPQMYQGQMYYPQMLQQGMEQAEMYNMEMQQPPTQEPRKKRKKKKKKRSSEHTNSNDDTLNLGYNTM